MGNTTVVALQGVDVLKIRKTALSREYKSETDGFKGKKYNIFTFRDKAFTVHQDDSFQVDFTNGKVFSLELGDSEEGYSLLNYQTVDQVTNMAKATGLIKFYEKYEPKSEIAYEGMG